MGIDTIVETTKDGVKIIRFNKPRRKNAIDKDMYLKVTEILNYAATDDNITMVVLTGTGDFYSSGNDLTSEDNLQISLLYVIKDLIKAMIKFPKLLIAIVNGPAVGVAVTSLALCDFVYASDNAYFYTPFTKLGIVAEGCSTYTFPKLIGERKSMELLLLNKKMPAWEALQCGLVSNVWKSEELQEKAWAQIGEISKLSSHSIVTTKKLLRRFDMETLLETNEIEFEELIKIRAMKSKL